MSRLWRYKRDGQECGPVAPDDLKMLAESQRLLPTDLVCKDGTNHWFAARGIRGLFPKPTSFGRLVAWMGPTGLVAVLLAVLLVGGGVGFLVYALRSPAPPPAPVAPAAPAAPAPPVEARGHTHLLNALHEMRDVRGELRGAGHAFGGGLDDVSRTLDRAIDQTEKALRAAGVNVDDARNDPDAYQRYSDHPHISEARDQVIEARTEIKDSKDDLGGERDRTVAQLTFAADKLEAAMKNGR